MTDPRGEHTHPTKDEYEFLLSQQHESLHHVQTHAQTLIRTLVAALSIIASSVGVAGYLSSFSIPAPTTIFTRDGINTFGTFEPYAQFNLIVAGSLAFLALVFLLDAMGSAVGVLQSTPLPISPAESEVSRDRRAMGMPWEAERMDFRYWTQWNEKRVTTLHGELQSSYRRLTEASFFVLMAIALTLLVIFGAADLLTLFNLALTAGGIFFIAHFVVFRGKPIEDEASDGFGVTSHLESSFKWRDDAPSPSVVMLTMVVLFMTAVYSIFFNIIWVGFVWLPRLGGIS